MAARQQLPYLGQWANQRTWKPIYETMRAKMASYADLNITDDVLTSLKNTIINSTRDLGPIYGYQWRHFGGTYAWQPPMLPHITVNPINPGIDQLKKAIETIKTDPTNRRIIVNAWNPTDMDKMALPPCHIMHQVLVHDNKLHLIWTQRSCDMFLGVPYNIASYALLLLLYAKETGYEPGILRGELHDVHIYENHIPQVRRQLSREPYKLPTVKISDRNWDGMLNWCAKDGFELRNYICHEKLTGEVAR